MMQLNVGDDFGIRGRPMADFFDHLLGNVCNNVTLSVYDTIEWDNDAELEIPELIRGFADHLGTELV